MPTIYREKGYRFRFSAADRAEPMHVHIRGGGGSAKVWLAPTVRLERSHGYTRAQMREIAKITNRERGRFTAAWRAFFG